jgi:hypothetical protein
MKQLMPHANFEYWHFNHPKVNLDLQIPLTSLPDRLNRQEKFYDQGEVIAVNTWIGVWDEIFAKHGGVNIFSLYDSWSEIFKKLGLSLHDDLEKYLPTVDYSFFKTENVDSFAQNNTRKRILFCNGKPMSNQSFDSDMSEMINDLASHHEDIDFICTKKFSTKLLNVLFTDDIIRDTEEFFTGVKPYWFEKPTNTCDLNEISYLSTKCNAIVGKNSGPYVFCETYDNLKDPSKVMVSFCKGPKETMSNGVNVKAKYRHVTDHSESMIRNTLEWVINEIKT